MTVNVVKGNRETLPVYRLTLTVTIDRVGDGWEPHELKAGGILRESAVEIPTNQISNVEHLGNACGAMLVMSVQSALGEEIRRIAPAKPAIVDPKTGETTKT